jgi:hypothetical protein
MASLQYDLYNYVAANSPGSAKAVLDKFGYDASQVDTVEVLGAGLATMVKENGEDALKAVLSIHPDREVLTQEFTTTAAAAPASNGKSGCGCGGCKGASSALESYLSKVGAPASSNNNAGGLMNVQHGNMLLIGGILILAVAIIVTKK